MYRNFTKLSFAGVVAVALLAFGITSFFAPAWAAKVKTCADGNISACVLDALDAYLAQQVKIVFVSSTEQNGNLGGVAGADAICRGLAADAGLHGLYRAWIATSSTDDPVSRFYQSPAPYILVDGTMVATDWDDLTDGTLLAPIDIDETGGVHSGDFAWTNVNTDGSLTSAVTTEQCQGWTVTKLGASSAKWIPLAPFGPARMEWGVASGSITFIVSGSDLVNGPNVYGGLVHRGFLPAAALSRARMSATAIPARNGVVAG